MNVVHPGSHNWSKAEDDGPAAAAHRLASDVLSSRDPRGPHRGRTDLPGPSVPEGLGGSYVPTLTQKTIQGIREAIGGGLVQGNPSREGPYPTVSLSYGNGTLSVRPPGRGTDGYVPPDEVERVRAPLDAVAEAYGDEDVDVLDILLGKWIASTMASGADTAVRVGVDEVLHERGVAKKRGGSGSRGGYRPKERRRIWGSVLRLCHLYVDATERVWSGAGHPEQRVRGYVAVVADEAGTGEGAVPRAFTYRPGPALAGLLLGETRQYTFLPRRVLAYHPVNRSTEKRIARWLAYRWRVGAKKGHAATVRVRQLIEKAGEGGRFETDHRGRARKRVEKALEVLRADGVIGAWAYVGDEPATTRARGSAQAWSSRVLTVEPPAHLREHLRAIGHARGRAQGPGPPS